MKSIHTLAICATIFFVGFSCSRGLQDAAGPGLYETKSASSSSAQRWEYVSTIGRGQDIPGFKEMGKEGWELVAFDNDNYPVFKRPLN